MAVSGLGAVIAIAGIVLLFTPLHPVGVATLPVGIVACLGALIATAVSATGEEQRAFAKAPLVYARIVEVVSNGGAASPNNSLHFDVHVEIAQQTGTPLKRIVGVVGDAGFAHTHLNPGQSLWVRHNTTDPDGLFDAYYDGTAQVMAQLKRLEGNE